MGVQINLFYLLCCLLVWFSPDVVQAQYDPTGLGCSSPDSTSLVFTWSRPAGGSGTVLGYHLDLVRTDGVKVDVLQRIDVNNFFVETYTYYGLGKYAVYELTIHSYTAGGNQNDLTLSCMTIEDIPDQAPSGVNATGISYSEIFVRWNELEIYYRNGILEGYKIVYFSYGSDVPHFINVSSTTFEHTITGLAFDTYYVVSVLAFTSAGDGPRGTNPDKTLGLPTAAPEVVQKYYCYEVIPGTLEIDWEGMPCTVYVGIISGLFTFMTIFMVICCCKCCGGGDAPKGGGGDIGLNTGSGGGSGGGSKRFSKIGRSVVTGLALGGMSKKASKNAVQPYKDEGYYEDDEDGFPYHGENRGNLTTRDIWIASPVEDRTFERPPPAPAKVPIVSKMMNREASGVDLEVGEDSDDPYTNMEDNFSNENENNDSVDNDPSASSNPDNQPSDASFF